MSENTIPYKNSDMLNKYSNNVLKMVEMILGRIIKKDIIIRIVAFLLARCSVLGGLTPFGISFYSAVHGSSTNMYFVFMSVAIGILSTGIGISQIKYIISLIVIALINAIIPTRSSTSMGVRTFFTIFLVGTVVVFYKGFLLYDFVLNLFEASLVFIFSLLFRNGIKYFKVSEKINAPTNNQIISLTIIAILSIGGIGTFGVFGINMKNILIILIIMLFSINNGISIGATIGIIAGMIISMFGNHNPMIIGVFGFCGLMAGVFRELGKLGVIIGFLLTNAIITMYINGSTEIIINIKDIFAAGIIFILVPKKLINQLSNYCISPSTSFKFNKNRSEKLRDMATQKLCDFSDSFYELAATFSQISEKNVNVNKDDIFTIFEEVAERVCKGCKLNTNCWAKRSYETYEVMGDIIKKLDSNGQITRYDIPQHFRGRCIKLDDFINCSNHMYELYNVNLKWRYKIAESRILIMQQIDAVSKVISDFTREVDEDIFFDSELEKKIQIELLKSSIETDEVMVVRNKSRKYEVSLSLKNLDDLKNKSNVVQIVSNVIGRRMERNECKGVANTDMSMMKLYEYKKYRVTTGVAKISKSNNVVSGDNYATVELDEGKFVLAISDGMGSGQNANLESNTVLSLIQKFLKSGISKNLSIEIINSILLLKSTEDSFATVDLSIIDLFNANVELIKNGAAATFIKKKNRVEILNSSSLPVGILNNIEMEVSKNELEDGDLLVMVTDGVLDSKKDLIQKEEWIFEELLNSDFDNPKLLADYLLNMAKENYRDNEIDDMTILVAKISERIY